ncbi:MAG: hypothetical protein LC623_08310, partial [Halobacteriales archaeon]|nr:hypothetical protein [Halobacteriales archaeon]
ALAGCSGGSPDGDRDSLADAQEANGWDIQVTALDGTVSARHVTSDPGNRTTDGTLLADTYKYALGLDPRSQDTDGDGLLDCQEVLHSVRSACLDPGFTGTTDRGTRTLANDADTDNDGLSDGQEVDGPVRTDPLRADTDGDVLRDGDEARLHADPTKADTDGDGCRDGTDAFPEADVRLVPGLGNLTWKAGQPAHLRFYLVMLGSDPAIFPDQDLAVQPGQAIDLSRLAQPALRTDCTFLATAPWLNLDLQLRWTDAPGGARQADLASLSKAGDGTHTAFYNPRADAFSASLDGTAPAPAPLLLAGADATLEVHPYAVTPGGARFKEDNQNS